MISIDQYLLSLFGLRDYEAAMRLPRPLVEYAVDASQRAEVRKRLDALMDAAMASELGLGKEYIDPSKPANQKSDPKAPYWSLEPFNRYRNELMNRIVPAKSAEQIRAEREAAEDADFAKLELVMYGGKL